MAYGKALVRQVRLAAVLVAGSSCAQAAEFRLGESIEASVKGLVTFGTAIRTEQPQPQNFGPIAGNRVGRPGGLALDNSGSSNLNFERGEPYSTVLKGYADIDVHGRSVGAFTRLKAWYDYELDKGDRPYGNFPNGFRQGVPLSDEGFAREARFGGAQFTAAYLYGRFDVREQDKVEARLGRQILNWGKAQFTTGGINVINPTDFAANTRPGAVSEERRIPVGMFYADYAAGKQWGVDGFVQYEFRHDVLNGCGTFFSVDTYAPDGCLQANVLPIPEPTAFATGLYVHRNPDVETRDSGQFGLSLRYTVPGLATEFRGYAINYHSRTASIRGTNPNVGGTFGTFGFPPGSFTRLTDPNGVKYALLFVEDIRLYGLSFESRPGRATRIFGEVGYRPNQPLSLNFADLADAFVARNPASLLNQPASGKNALALPPGATFDAYDRFRVTTASLGVNQGLPGILGAQVLLLAGELGWSHVHGLPSTNVLRYGRNFAYGVAAVPGFACVDRFPGRTCVHDGFVTSNAWGHRTRIAMTYNDAFLGATLTPSLIFAHDVDGYSYDGSFLEDRKVIISGMRAEWRRTYFAEIQYTRFSNVARYSMIVDRDNVALVAGVTF